jgi:CheY-like chemotaxis protein/biopolymer transport protein ExbD
MREADRLLTPTPISPPVAESVRARVLVIDDELPVASMLSRVLADQHDVHLATSAREALELLSRQDFDVILCDLLMPGMSGMDLHAELATRAPGASWCETSRAAFVPARHSISRALHSSCAAQFALPLARRSVWRWSSMAGIDAGGGASRRDVNRDVPLVPFIDFLLCLVSFLLITAVWSQNARLESTAQVPALDEPRPTETPKRLHVDVRDRKFELTWKQGSIVLARYDVERKPVAQGEPRYPELARRIAAEWQQAGAHKAPSDATRDQVVLHAVNDLEFGELAAVLDAIHATRRPRDLGDRTVEVSAFDVSFAVN